MRVFTLILVLLSTDLLLTFAAKLGRNEDDRFTSEESGWEPDINSGSGLSEEKVGDSQAGIVIVGNSPIKPMAPSSLNSISTRSIIPISPGNSMPVKATEGAQSSFIPAVGASASPVVPPQLPSSSIGSSQLPQPPPVPLPSISKPAIPISQPSPSLRMGLSTQPAKESPSSQLLQPSVSAPQMKPHTVPSVSQPPAGAQNLKPASSISVVYNPSEPVSPPVGQNRPTLVVNPNQSTMLSKTAVSAIESLVPNTPFSAKPYTKVAQPAQSLKIVPSVAFSKVSGVVKSSSYAKVPQVASSVSVLPNPSLLSQVKISPKSSQVTAPQVTTQVLSSSVSQSEFNHEGHPSASIPPKTRFQSLVEGSENKNTENGISDKKLSSKDSLNAEGSTNIVDITQGSGSGFGEGITAEEQHIATALAQDSRTKTNSKQSEQDPAKMINNKVEKSLEDYYKHQEPFTFSRRPIAKNNNKPQKLLERSTKSRPQALGNTESQKSIQIKSFWNKVSHEGTYDTPKEQQAVVIEGIHNGQLQGTDTPHEQALPRLSPPLITINVEPSVQKVEASDQLLTENESESDVSKETADITVRESSEVQNKGAQSPEDTIVEVKIGFMGNHQGVPSDQTFSQEKRKEEIDLGKEQRRDYRRYNSHAKQPEPTPTQEDNIEEDDTYDYIHDDDDGKKMISKKSEQNQIEQHTDADTDEKPSHEETSIEGKSRNNTKHKHKRHHHHHHGKHKKLQQKHKGKSADDSNQVYNHDSNHPESQLLTDDLSRFVEVNGFITTVGDQSEEHNTHGEAPEEHSRSENEEGSGKKKHSHKKRHKKKHKKRHHRRHNKTSEDLEEDETKIEMLPLTTESIGEVSDININNNVFSLDRKSGHRRHKKNRKHRHHKHHRKSPNDMTFNSPEELENINGYTILEKDLSENPILETLDEKVKKHKKRRHHRRRRHRHHHNHHEGRHYHHKRHHHRKRD